MHPPRDLSKDALFGLLYSLLLSLDRKGVLTEKEFIEDLGKLIESANEKKILPPSAESELSRVHKWFESESRRGQA